MTTAASTVSAVHVREQVGRYDWLMLGCCTWLVTGLFIDGWAHFHLVSATESFFTPWHALLYSGFFACAALLASTIITNSDRSLPFWRRVPAGYEASVVALAIFGIGGIGDMLWHVLVGVEKDIATQLSPSHLVLALGLVLIVGGPFRAGATRLASSYRRSNLRTDFPAVFSAGLALAVITLFTKALQPGYIPWESGDWQLMTPNPANPFYNDVVYLQQALGVACFLVQSTLIMSVLLVAFRRKLLSPGAVTIILVTASALFDVSFLLVSLVCGLIADAFLYQWRRSAPHPYALRLFAFAIPALLCAFFQLEILFTRGGIWWPSHLVAGSIILCGLAGLAVSYLVLPSPADRGDLPLPVG